MNREEFRKWISVAVLSVAGRFGREFEEAELGQYVDDLMHGLSPGRLALIPEALAAARRDGIFFPKTGEIRAAIQAMPIDPQYLDRKYRAFTARVLAESREVRQLKSLDSDTDIRKPAARPPAIPEAIRSANGPDWEDRIRRQAEAMKRQIAEISKGKS